MSKGGRREPAAVEVRRTGMAQIGLSPANPQRAGRLAGLVVALAAACVAAGCAQGSTTPSARAAESARPSPSSAATSVPGSTAPATTGPTTESISPAPPVGRSTGVDAVPPNASAVAVSLIAQTLVAVTDRDMYGPVSVTDAQKVSQVAAVINAARAQRGAIVHCPMEGTGNMTLVFRSGASGSVTTTVVISTSGCPGMIVRSSTGGLVSLAGGPDQVAQIETILGVPWPRPAG